MVNAELLFLAKALGVEMTAIVGKGKWRAIPLDLDGKARLTPRDCADRLPA